jgi:hypothetical protein
MADGQTLLVTIGAGLLAVAPLHGQNLGNPPTPMAAVKHACDAAGGLATFDKLGVLELTIKREEVTQEGKVTDTAKKVFFLTPGPTPARTEDPQLRVVAGDDGSGGWALIGGRPDARPSTTYMVKRLITTDLFPLMLPFSLTWEGVTVTDVTAAKVDGHDVWKLKVQLAPTFFHSPQISTAWTVDVDRTSFALLRAESPATDLGKGVTADGMRFSWRAPTNVKNVRLCGVQEVIGLDEFGREKSHSRIDHISYTVVPRQESERLFGNPIPPEERPKLPGPQPPQPPGGKPGA